MLIFIEMITYIFYIYWLCFLFILIKPTYLTLFLFFIYCFITTWYVFLVMVETGCKIKNFKWLALKFILVLVYSIFCIYVYYFIHYYWKLMISKILLLPLIYFISIKIVEKFFQCKKSFTIRFLESKIISLYKNLSQ